MCIERITRASTVPSPTAGVEYPKRRRAGMDSGELQRHPRRRPPASRRRCGRTAGISAGFRRSGNCRGGRAFPAPLRRPRGGGIPPGIADGDIGLDALQRIDGDALALTQAVHQLAVVDGAAPEGGFRHIRLTAELRNLGENLVVFHEGLWERRWAGATAPISYHFCPPADTFKLGLTARLGVPPPVGAAIVAVLSKQRAQGMPG